MTKVAEQNYLSAIGEEGRLHAFNKPFSDPNCEDYLASVAVIMSLLPPPPARILDFGCGTGWTSTFLALRGYDVVGQDISPEMIALARANKARYGACTLNFVEGDFEDLAFAEEFDAALFFDCLHHCDDEEAALRTAFGALKAGGVLITHEPGEGHSTHPTSVEVMKAYGTNERDMPPRLIIKTARKVGFRDADVLPMPAPLHRIFYPLHGTGRRFWAERRLLRPLLRFRLVQALLSFAHAAYKSDRRSAVVVLVK